MRWWRVAPDSSSLCRPSPVYCNLVLFSHLFLITLCGIPMEKPTEDVDSAYMLAQIILGVLNFFHVALKRLKPSEIVAIDLIDAFVFFASLPACCPSC